MLSSYHYTHSRWYARRHRRLVATLCAGECYVEPLTTVSGSGTHFCRRRRLLVGTPDGHAVEVVGCLHPVHHELAPSIYPAFKKGKGKKTRWVPGEEEPMKRGPKRNLGLSALLAGTKVPVCPGRCATFTCTFGEKLRARAREVMPQYWWCEAEISQECR